MSSFDMHLVAGWHLLSFKCPDVGAVGSRGPGDGHGAGETALIDPGAEPVRTLINGGAGAKRRVSEGRAAMVLQGAEQRVGVELITDLD